MKDFLAKFVPPTLILLVGLVAWEIFVRARDLPVYILPSPTAIFQALITDWATLYPSLLVTLAITAGALAAATIIGVLIAVLFAQSKWVELSFFPYAVILQVTPVV
ncbi:MAG TPA: ABC transporter permease, partial [Burkholderiales bacterium]|nr:ABC transporter permease [Burkholderiales bacterium]